MNNFLNNETIANSVFIPTDTAKPNIHKSAAIRNSHITGNVIINENVHIVNAAIRADEGTPFYIGKNSNIQDFCILHGYAGQKEQQYAIYIGEHVSISHGAMVHGPAQIKDNTFIGFKATIDAANVGSNVEIGPHSYIKGVKIPDNTAIAPNAVITKEEDIEKFIIEPTGINEKIVNVNLEMAKAYNSIQ